MSSESFQYTTVYDIFSDPATHIASIHSRGHPGEARLRSTSADVLPADSQQGPSGWHQPVSGGYQRLHFWDSTLEN